MSLVALLLIAGAGLGFSALDWLRKSLSHRMPTVPLLWALSLGAVPFNLAWWGLGGWGSVGAGYWFPGLGSLMLNVAANLLFLNAIRIGGLSATIPLLSLTPVFTALLAVPLLDERLSAAKWVGILAVVCGALLLQVAERKAPVERRRDVWLGGLLMASVALLWSATTPLDKVAMASAPPAFHALLLNAGIAVVLTGWLLSGRQARSSAAGDSRVPLVLLALTVVVGVVALGAQLLALGHSPAGLVETLKRGIGCVSALIVGWAYFGEAISWQKVSSLGLIVAGVWALVT